MSKPNKSSFWEPDDPTTISKGMEGLVIFIIHDELHPFQMKIETMRVENMGGRVTRHLSEATHFVSEVTATTHYYEAIKAEIKVMRLEWIIACYNACKKGTHLKATDEPFIHYECPAFYNIQVFVVGVCHEKKMEIQRKLENNENGGIFCDQLVPTTDLIILGKEKLSEKEYVNLAENVTKYDTPIVKPKYLKVSFEYGFPFPLNTDGASYKIGNDRVEEIKQVGLTKPKHIFKGLKIYAAGFTYDNYERLKYAVERRGGEWTSSNVDCLILPISGIGDFEAKIKVNEVWIRSCIEEERVIHKLSYYHVPFFFEIFAQPLTNCVITIIGFGNIETKYLVMVAEQLGAWCQKKVCLNTDTNYKKTTHIICDKELFKTQQVSELEEHKSIRILNKQWIVDAAKSMFIQPCVFYELK